MSGGKEEVQVKKKKYDTVHLPQCHHSFFIIILIISTTIEKNIDEL